MRTYYPKSIEIEKETYNLMLSIAKGYYRDKNRLNDISGNKMNSTKDERVNRQVRLLKERTDAVECALRRFSPEQQNIIRQNLFQGVPLIQCNTQKSEVTGKRVRHKFLVTLAYEFGEI